MARPRLIRLGVIGLTTLAAAAALLALPSMLSHVGDEASDNSALSFSDREIAGGNGIVADQSAVYAARALIPEDESYHVAVNPGYTGGSELTREHVASYFRYFLMPRRPAERARWIVCYGCDISAYGAGAETVWKGSEGISIVRAPS